VRFDELVVVEEATCLTESRVVTEMAASMKGCRC
jgi:hypothetical protein